MEPGEDLGELSVRMLIWRFGFFLVYSTVTSGGLENI